MENSNSNSDFEAFKIIKCFDFGQMKKKLSNYFLQPMANLCRFPIMLFYKLDIEYFSSSSKKS